MLEMEIEAGSQGRRAKLGRENLTARSAGSGDGPSALSM